MYLKFILAISFGITANAYVQMVVPDHKNAFDQNLYQDVLDPEKCAEQIEYIGRDAFLLAQFLNAGSRTPRGILKGNLIDLGSYYECLEIREQVENMDNNIEGKYCMVNIPLNQEIDSIDLPNWMSVRDVSWPELPWSELNSNTSRIKKKTLETLKTHEIMKSKLLTLAGLSSTDTFKSNNASRNDLLQNMAFKLAVCIPKPCSVDEAFKVIFGGLEQFPLQFKEEYCRIPKDKPLVVTDYVVISILSTIGLLIILSTSYDIRHSIILKKDAKSANKLYQSFSIYTNSYRLVTYTPVPGAIECLDGIRSIAMMWVVIGHTFLNQMTATTVWNPLDIVDWITSFSSLWITAAPITVDTFFMLTGLLLVYTTAGKLTRSKFMKNLHLFYLNRYLRLLPVLAASILLQASIFNHVTDGPEWGNVAQQTHQCRVHWWPTMLYIQNYYSPAFTCLPHTWYLAIDFQLFIISPLILIWVVSGRKRTAWIGLVAGLLISLTAATIYNFIMGFASASFGLSEPKEDQPDYTTRYYINTLTRAPPFFVGMLFGYLLYVLRGKKLVIPKIQVALLWLLTIVLSSAVMYSGYPALLEDWDNQLADNFLNSFRRPIWAMCIGWLVISCVHGYGGPVNWLLSHPMWKILSRLSYAMYILHYQLMFVVNGTFLGSVYITVESSIHQFFIDFVLTVIVSFIVTLCFDSPCSVLIKHFLGGPKRVQTTKQTEVRSSV